MRRDREMNADLRRPEGGDIPSPLALWMDRDRLHDGKRGDPEIPEWTGRSGTCHGAGADPIRETVRTLGAGGEGARPRTGKMSRFTIGQSGCKSGVSRAV